MSHTTQFNSREYGVITIIHNGGWDGPLTVKWEDRYGEQEQKEKEVELPGPLLTLLGMKVAVENLKTHVIGAIEDWDPKP